MWLTPLWTQIKQCEKRNVNITPAKTIIAYVLAIMTQITETKFLLRKTGKDNYYIEIIQNKPKGIIKTITKLHISKKIKRAMKPRPNKQKLGESR